jgi:Domain of unknown function (DUF4760)
MVRLVLVVNPTQSPAEPIRWLGETFGFWIQAGILAVSAFGGVWIIRSRGKQEQRRATVDLIIDIRLDPAHIDARETIKNLHEKGEKNLARYLNDLESAEYKAIMFSLNIYEFFATGIRTNALSEGIYKRLYFSVVLRDWESFQGFVMEFRKQKASETFFQEFEWLYHQWKKKPLKRSAK